jgi:hypothetical protein
MMKKILLIIIVFIANKESTIAQIMTDRPDQTESSSTVPKGALQLESGILVGYEGDNLYTNRQLLLPTNLFRYGITKGVELRVLNQVESIKYGDQNIQGISDLEIGTKIQLLKNEAKNTEIAFLSHLVLPTGTKGLSRDIYGTINKLCISHSINENIGLGYNIGYNYFDEGNGDITYSISLGIGLTDKVAVYIEPYGEIANIEKHISNFDAGFTYLLNKNTQLDFSFGTSINQEMNYASIGCSWLFGDEER